jgi:hypothetical protein
VRFMICNCCFMVSDSDTMAVIPPRLYSFKLKSVAMNKD